MSTEETTVNAVSVPSDLILVFNPKSGQYESNPDPIEPSIATTMPVEGGPIDIEVIGATTITPSNTTTAVNTANPTVVGRGGGVKTGKIQKLKKFSAYLMREHFVSIHLLTLIGLVAEEISKLIGATTGVNYYVDGVGILWASTAFGFAAAIVGFSVVPKTYPKIRTFPIIVNITGLFVIIEFILAVAFFAISIKVWYFISMFVFNVILFVTLMGQLVVIQWRLIHDQPPKVVVEGPVLESI